MKSRRPVIGPTDTLKSYYKPKQGEGKSFLVLSEAERQRLVQEHFDFAKIQIQYIRLFSLEERRIYIENNLLQYVKERKNCLDLESVNLIEISAKYLNIATPKLFELLGEDIDHELGQKLENLFDTLVSVLYGMQIFSKYLEESNKDLLLRDIVSIAITLRDIVGVLYQIQDCVLSTDQLPCLYSRAILEIFENVKDVLLKIGSSKMNSNTLLDILLARKEIEQSFNLYNSLYKKHPIERLITSFD